MFEVNDDGDAAEDDDDDDEDVEKNYIAGKLDRKGRLRCPMCRGRGYFNPTEQCVNGGADPFMPIEEKNERSNAFKLPAMESKAFPRQPKQRKKITLPSIKTNFSTRALHNKPKAQIPVNGRSRPDFEANAVLSQFRQIPKPATANSNESEPDRLLIPSPKTPKNPQDYLRSNLIKLQGSDWSESLNALMGIVQISRYQPDCLEGSMVVIYRSITSLLRSFRSKITRTACQAVSELFSNVPNTQRPEFDELIAVLLQKTADTNKFVRRDANEALDSMAINILPIHCVRILAQKGITHRNSIVRSTAARLLVCIVGMVGINTVYAGNKETRNRIMTAGAQCLQDGCQEVRNYGCRLMKMLMEHEDFDEVLQATVSGVLINRIEKVLITLKYHK